MGIPYFARYAYAEKLSLFEDQASISISTLPAMERLSKYLTDDDVRKAEPLPEDERIAALAEFEGVATSEASTMLVLERDQERLPVNVFISSAKEDGELALAISRSLGSLGEKISGMITIFVDFSDIAQGEPFRDALTRELGRAEFLLVLTSRSNQFANFEVGFFNALIQEDLRRSSRTIRRIVHFDLEEPPPIGCRLSLGVDISIAVGELWGSRDDYLQSFAKSSDKEDSLFRLYDEIARLAESRLRPLPPSLRTDPEKLGVAQALVPVRAAIFDSMRTRIASEAVWGGAVDFDLPELVSGKPSIPDDANWP
jgi:hypothetical protein